MPDELNATGKRDSQKQSDARRKGKLVVDLGTKSKGSTSLWFDQDIFNDINMDEVEDDEPPSHSPEVDGSDNDETAVRFVSFTTTFSLD